MNTRMRAATSSSGSLARGPALIAPAVNRRALRFLTKAADGNRYYVTCHPGLEQVVAGELSHPNIGAHDVVPGKAGVTFSGPRGLETGMRANLWLRSGIRVLLSLAEGDLEPRLARGARGADALYDFIYEAAPWADVIPPGATFSVEVRLWSCADLSNASVARTRIKDAICDAVRDSRGAKPLPPAPYAPPYVPLYVALYQDQVAVYRDMSGDSLHRRGYRGPVIHKSALNEAAAAGVLHLAGWHDACAATAAGGEPLVLADPMCGSGTLLVEAALMALNHAPGLYRARWPFESWPDFQPAAWRQVVQEARAASKHVSALTASTAAAAAGSGGGGGGGGGGGTRGVSSALAQTSLKHVRLAGNELHSGALALARNDVAGAGLGGVISLDHGDCAAWAPPAKPHLVVTNPPWGQRLMAPGGGSGRYEDERVDDGRRQRQQLRDGEDDEAGPPTGGDLDAAWSSLSTFLKTRCNDADAFVLCGNPDATRALRMRADRRLPLTLGGVDARLLKYRVLPPLPPAVAAEAAARRQQGLRKDLPAAPAPAAAAASRSSTAGRDSPRSHPARASPSAAARSAANTTSTSRATAAQPATLRSAAPAAAAATSKAQPAAVSSSTGSERKWYEDAEDDDGEEDQKRRRRAGPGRGR